MLLEELADRIVGPISKEGADWALRVILVNFDRGILQSKTRHEGFKDRLDKWGAAASANFEPISVDRLHTLMREVLLTDVADRHFLDTDRPITCNLESKAFTIVTHDAVRSWAGWKASEFPPDVHELEKIRQWCGRPARGGVLDHRTLGLPSRAIWLTPERGPLFDLLERARALNRDPNRRADDERFSTIADDLWLYLGLSQYECETCLIAAVTRRTLGELLELPPGPDGGKVMGPSVLEGGTHTRWRHWPEDFGRTYMLCSGSSDAGAAEAVRRPLPLEEVEEFIYLGPVTLPYGETNAAFAQAIGVTDEVPQLVRKLARRLAALRSAPPDAPGTGPDDAAQDDSQ